MNKPERIEEGGFGGQPAREDGRKPADQRLKLRRLARAIAVMAIDFTIVCATLYFAVSLQSARLFANLDDLAFFTVCMGAFAVATYALAGLYKRSWRFMSFAHSSFVAVVILGGLGIAWLCTFILPVTHPEAKTLFPVAVTHWAFATIAMLGVRVLRRLVRQASERRHVAARSKPQVGVRKKAILIGSWQWARASVEIAQADHGSSVEILGVLLPRAEDALVRVDSIDVLGTQHELAAVLWRLEFEKNLPDHVIVCDDGTFLSNRDVSRIIHVCRERKVEVCRVRDTWAQLLQHTSDANGQLLPIRELLGRSEYNLDNQSVRRQIAGRCILVTGAGGTIGSELCHQIAQIMPSSLVLLDSSEFNIYQVEMSLKEAHPNLHIVAEIASICDAAAVNRVFAANQPAIVFHAAALKHVPIVEANPSAGAQTNIIGTRNISNAVCQYGARAMVQVSTDKAVNPIGVMGATKRVGELYCQALDMCGVDDSEAPRFMTVRFGNVLGSSGSIVPLFERQLREGKPLTVTHPDIERFFMTVREAVQLILQSSSSALESNLQRGSIFVLDMGNPVRIVDLARRMITLYGLEPDEDVPIQFVGLRPGEKLYEELFDICEEQVESGIEGIFVARSRPIPLPFINLAVNRIAELSQDGNDKEIVRLVHGLARFPAHSDHGDLAHSDLSDFASMFEKAYRADTANDC